MDESKRDEEQKWEWRNRGVSRRGRLKGGKEETTGEKP